MDSVTVTISKGLADQLAGVSKPTAGKEKKRPSPRSKEEQETLTFLRENEEIREALKRSRKVGKLLIKREEEELKKVHAQVEELGQLPLLGEAPSDACRGAREAVAACCQEHGDGVLGCVSLIDAYAACAKKQFVDSIAVNPQQQQNS